MDLSLFNLIHGLAGKEVVLDWVGIFLGAYLGYALIIASLFLLFKEKKWKTQYYFFSLTALSVLLSRGVIAQSIRFFYMRPRPFTALGFSPLISETPFGSFPSGHASFFFALATAAYLFSRTKHRNGNRRILQNWDILLFAGAFLLGIGRIFAGVHWPSDILGGAIIGIVSAVVIKKILPLPSSGDALSG